MTTPTIARLTGPYGARLDRKTYWRLVMPGEIDTMQTQFAKVIDGKVEWHECGLSACHYLTMLIHRRRVTVLPRREGE